MARTENQLTDLRLRRERPGPKDRYLRDGGGLWARVLKGSGKVVFEFRFKLEGRNGCFHCGTYGETGADGKAVTLASARARRNQARALVAEGIDPAESARQAQSERKAREAAERREHTIAGLFEDWRRRYLAASRKDGGAEMERIFRLDVLPRLGELKAKEVTRRQIGELLDTVVDRGARRVANKLLEGLRQMFRWALARDIVAVDPTIGLTKRLVGGEEKPRERALSFDEVAELLAKLPAAGLAPEIHAGVLMLLATGCRIGELLKAKWSDIDEAVGTWRIPAENAKNGESHLIHLSLFARTQLAVMQEKRSGEYLLNGRKAGAPYEAKSLTHMLRDRVRAKPLKNRTERHAGKLLLRGGDWSPHDLRRTMATRMGDLGILPHVIERCLGHKPPSKLLATYQRAEYLPERAEAFRLWGERLELLAKPERNVVLLPARA